MIYSEFYNKHYLLLILISALLSAGHDAVSAEDRGRWAGLTVPVDHGHPAPVGDVGHQAQPLRGPAAVEPALGEVPAGGDEQDVLQAGQAPAAVSPLLTDQSGQAPAQSQLTLQVGRLICLQTSWISAVLSSVCSSHKQLELLVP